MFNGQLWGVLKQSDCVINLVYGSPGQEGLVPMICESIGVAYIGSDQFSSFLVKNKMLTKIIAKQNRIKTPKAFLYSTDNLFLDDISYPVVVKPNQKGGLSLGISYCETRQDIHLAIECAQQYDDSILVEEYITGREFSVCAIEMDGELQVLPIIEIIKSSKICDYDTKSLGKRKLKVAPQLPTAIQESFAYIVKTMFKALSLRDYAYFDFILSGANIFFIEAGAVPGFTSNSNLPVSLAHLGIDCADFFADRITYKICSREKKGRVI